MMEHAADPSHPRYKSLLMRARLELAAKAGMLADSALIAHGRGEAFDYLLGEKTCDSALQATKEAAARLRSAKRPVISLNGNAIALAADDLLKCAALMEGNVEVNIFYHTPERMMALVDFLREAKERMVSTIPERWKEKGKAVKILGTEPDARIPGLEGPRAKCHSNGILAADVLLVPLEDGDRCEALVDLGKDVIVVDLNPMSRSARMATVTVVDELSRFASNLFLQLQHPEPINEGWDNGNILQLALDDMKKRTVF